MLACIPRHQNFSQHLVCTTRVLEVVPPLALAMPTSQPYTHKGVSVSTATRYPTPAELDAFAQRTASSPLSITIFPNNVRVPQQKQLNRTVNGLDTTGQRFSPYSHPPSLGSRGLLAVVKGSAILVKAVVKNSDGRRTKHAPPPQTPPFSGPPDGGGVCYAPDGQPHKAYCHGGAGTSRVLAPDGPSSGTAAATARGQAPPPPHDRSRLCEVRGALMRRVNVAAAGQAPPPWGGGARVSPSHQAVAAVARSDSGFVLGVVAPPQSGLAFSGAVLPTQSADMAKGGYLEGGDYGVWQHKHPDHHHQQQQQQQQQHHHLQQQYQQGSLRMFSSTPGGRGAESMVVGQSPQSSLPLGCSARPPCGPHPLSAGTGGAAQEQISSCAADFSLGPRYHAPSWDGGLTAAAPLTDCYAQELALPRDTGHPRPHNCLDPHPHHHPSHRPHPPQCHPSTTAQQAYSAEQGVCCGGGMGPHGGGPGLGPGLCHASVLSSSLQSLECLISEIHPPCIKERMLGRGYEALGLARLLEQHHHPHLHPHHQLPHPNIQLPVYR
ncbi:unnamed protein product [Arctogadus glacialis]